MNNKDNARRFLIRATGMILFVTAAIASSDCHAQRPRLFFNRGARIHNQADHHATRGNQNQFESSVATPNGRLNTSSRYFNPRNFNSWDPGSGNQRYIGGFHYTHFQNIGIPSGDIGLRGNAYHWRPW